LSGGGVLAGIMARMNQGRMVFSQRMDHALIQEFQISDVCVRDKILFPGGGILLDGSRLRSLLSANQLNLLDF
jgi:hypothetical protein